MSIPRRPKPIRVFFSTLSRRFYATRHYREMDNGVIECTGEKFDVTNDIAGIIEGESITFTRRDDAKSASGEPTT